MRKSKKTKFKELAAIISALRDERDSHLAALAELDEVFSAIGIGGDSTPAPARRGRPPKSAGGKRGPKPGRRKGKRGHRFPISGTNSILNFVTKSGEKGVSGKDIDRHWKSEGRAGSSYNILGQLVRAKKIKRHNLKGERGSMYTPI